MKNYHPITSFFSLLFLCLQSLCAQNPANISLCTNGTNDNSAAPAGTVYDSGGPFGGYQNGEYCTLLINPGCVTGLSFTVHEYATENCCDYLYVYDGENESAPLVANFQFLPIPSTINSTSGKLFLRWYSDGSVTSSGFRGTWTSTIVNPVPPELTISADDDTPALNEAVQFTAEATNYPYEWNWDFGDGTTSSEQNPSHTYAVSGAYTARLIVTNCYGLSDTATQAITMQGAPHMTINPVSFQVTTACSDTGHATITIANDGQGDLLYHLRGEADFGRRNVLIYTYSVNYNSLLGIQGLLNQHPNEYEVSLTTASDSAGLATDLVDKDILIIPEFPSNIDVWFLMSQNLVFQKFIAEGGSIVVCGSYYYNYFFSATGLITASGYYTTDVSYNNLSFPTIHGITQHMPAVYYAPYFAGSLFFEDTAYVSLCDFNGQSVVGYKEIGPGNVIYLGFNFQGVDTPLDNLMADALHWGSSQSNIMFSSESGKLPAGESLDVDVSFVTQKAVEGNYAGVIKVTTNNPAQATVEASFDLAITGQAVLQTAQATLQFDSIQQFSSQTKTLIVENPGCDTLQVYSIASDNAVITSNTTQLVILPFDTDTFSVSFAPLDTGLVSGILTLSSNADTIYLPVSGYAKGAPIAGITPDSLAIQLGCGAQSDVTLTFHNTGLGDLHLSSADAFENNSNGLKILILNGLSYYYSIAYNIEYWIKQAYPDAQIQYFDGSHAVSELPDYLGQANMVILPALGGGDLARYPEIGQYLKSYLNSGGSVLITGTPYTPELNSLGITEATGGYNSYSAPLIIETPGHPLLHNIDPNSLVYDDIFNYQFTSSNFVTVASSVNTPPNTTTYGYEMIGNGTLVYLGYEFDAGYQNVIQSVQNTVAWAARPRWVIPAQTELTVRPNIDGQLVLHFDASSLNAGQYKHTLRWHTDDPTQPVLTVPVTLTVSGDPVLQSTAGNLNFGVLQQFAERTLELPFSNAGCDTLHILSVTSDNSSFNANNFPAIVLPYADSKVLVKFSPLLPGAQSGTITVSSDGGTYSISVTGLAVGAPIASTTPGTLQVSLSCDGSDDLPLTLNNAGLGNLNFEIGNHGHIHSVAILNHGASYWRLQNIRYALQQTNANLQLVEIGSVNAQAFADSLQKADILLVPSLENQSDQTYNAYAPAIQEFLNRGGQVFVVSMYYVDPLVRLGLFPNFNVEGFGTTNVRVVYASHPIVYDLPGIFNPNDNFAGATFPGSANVKPLILAPNNSTYLGVRSKGQGNIVFWGLQFDYSLTNESFTIMSNLFNWANNPLPGGVTLQTAGGNIAPGASQTFNVHFDGAGIAGGTYTGHIKIYSNDPQHNPLFVPVQLTMSSTPCADFSYNIPACSGTVSFTDNTVNSLTSWYWQFGDGAEGFTQNPVHTYTSGGNYNVTLVGCNNFGCDTISSTIHIDAFNGPATINCHPQTQSYCCNAGVLRVKIGSLDNQTADASEGYQDFSCSLGTDIMAGEQIPIYIQTGNQGNEYVRVWIDFNNNGLFNTNELVFADNNYASHEGFITIPNSAVKNVRLRMRVSTDFNNYPTACGDLVYGQAEDYYVVSKTTVATDEPSDALAFKLYPNPAMGDVWMEVRPAGNEGFSVEISDLAGRLVYSSQEDGGDNARKLKLPALTSGTYLVKVQSGVDYKVEKLIKLDRP